MMAVLDCLTNDSTFRLLIYPGRVLLCLCGGDKALCIGLIGPLSGTICGSGGPRGVVSKRTLLRNFFLSKSVMLGEEWWGGGEGCCAATAIVWGPSASSSVDSSGNRFGFLFLWWWEEIRLKSPLRKETTLCLCEETGGRGGIVGGLSRMIGIGGNVVKGCFLPGDVVDVLTSLTLTVVTAPSVGFSSSVTAIATIFSTNTSILPRRTGPSHLLPFFWINAEACSLCLQQKNASFPSIVVLSADTFDDILDRQGVPFWLIPWQVLAKSLESRRWSEASRDSGVPGTKGILKRHETTRA